MTPNPMRFFSPTMRTSTLVVLGIGLLGSSQSLYANDSAAEVAAGGIQLRKEARISMEKERLTISLKRVTVEYEFLNSSDQDVSTEVAFPVPQYDFTPESAGGIRDFDDFRVWIDGREIKYRTDVRAKIKGTDHTAILGRLGLDIQSFARYPDDGNYDVNRSQIGKLSSSDRTELIRRGLTDEDGWPLWTVHKTYHWHQLFLAQKTVRVRHTYTAAVGFQPVEAKEVRTQLKGVCLSPALEERLNARENDHGLKYAVWIKYILTTANTWKTPIRDFELIVETPPPNERFQPVGTSVCWDGKVGPLDGRRLGAKKSNFVPTRELAVYYFSDR